MLTRTFNAKEYTLRLKATIQATGKLGFTAETIKTLRLTSECSILIGPDDENSEIYYMGVLREKRDDAFAVMSSGVYLYLNTKQLFDDMGIDALTCQFSIGIYYAVDTCIRGVASDF